MTKSIQLRMKVEPDKNIVILIKDYDRLIKLPNSEAKSIALKYIYACVKRLREENLNYETTDPKTLMLLPTFNEAVKRFEHPLWPKTPKSRKIWQKIYKHMEELREIYRDEYDQEPTYEEYADYLAERGYKKYSAKYLAEIKGAARLGFLK